MSLMTKGSSKYDRLSLKTVSIVSRKEWILKLMERTVWPRNQREMSVKYRISPELVKNLPLPGVLMASFISDSQRWAMSLEEAVT